MATLLLACVIWAAAQTGPVQGAEPQALEVRRSSPAGEWVNPAQPIELSLSRPLTDGEGRVAIVVGDADLTDLFEVADRRLTYRPGPVRLPPGESTVAVYLVTPANVWRQIATIPLKVTTPSGFESVSIGPRIDFSDVGQLGEAHAPSTNAPPRHRFQDATAGFGLRTQHVRDGITISTQTNLLGVTNETKAPRFAALGAAAPQLDLADYVWTVEHRRFKVSAGQGTFGTERHLAPGLASRGISLTLRRDRADVTFAAFNGTSIVGFDNFLGVSTTGNRVGLAQLGIELLPRPGSARVELSALEGERLPQSGFTQARVSDAERSHGGALRFVTGGLKRRLRIDSGIARSTFVNPPDPLLEQDTPVVAVKPRTNDAIYFDSSYDIVKNRSIGKTATLTLTPIYRLERVDPLFASVGAPQGLRSDVFQNAFGFNATAGNVTAQALRTISYDNLHHVPSILRTDTGVTAVNVVVPTGSLGQSSPGPLWPTVTYTLNRSTQVGERLPENGGFRDASQVPDQLNAVHTIRGEWAFGRAHAGYFLTRSTQDNRQPGRERSDFSNVVQGVSIGGGLGRRADVNADIGLERAASREFQQVTRTGHVSLTGTWHTTTVDTVTTIVNATLGRGPDGAVNDASDANLQYAHAFVLGQRGISRPRIQLFGRIGRQATTTFQPLAGVPTDRRHVMTFSIGLTCTVF